MVGSGLLLVSSLLLLAMAPADVLADGIKTRSATRYLSYNDPFQDKTRGDLLRHVKPGATKIDAAGRFSGKAVFFR